MTHPHHAGFPARRRGTKSRIALATGLVLALAVGTAYATELGPFGDPDGPDPAAVGTARDFLDDWAAGRTGQAGALTSRPQEADRILLGFTEGLEITKPTFTVDEPVLREDGSVRVPFTAKMPITDLGTWTYRSVLPVSRDSDGDWVVDWSISVVHPKLSATEKFRLQRGRTSVDFVDRAGKRLSAETHPSLAPALNELAGQSGGGPRGEIQRVNRLTGAVTATEVSFSSGSVNPPKEAVRTTLDATWQTAADKALSHAGGKNAALVALRVDNGEVLAMANSPASGFNRAASGTYAPGSTFKVVTTAALLMKQAVRPDQVVNCPKSLTVGKPFQNVEKSEHPGATFRDDFAESCNTAFIGLRGELSDAELKEVAGTYFGVGQKWGIGISSFDGSVPVPKDETEKAAAMIGQGKVLANPLVMASVTATAVSGTFHQPKLVPNAKDRTETADLPAGTVTQLRELMRRTVTHGTASVLGGLPGQVGAKTGTAEVNATDPNNGWLVAYRGNVAVACIVEQGITGGGSAGPVIRDLFSTVPGDPT
ncbi:penicillin-binding transpeptidase domain-containing protein [Streptomyces sp. NPDC029554]|uniref:penicillin-binding transpeptidase domain-containing protein n=1 Tax=Streptomyces sp. NPDC029554 TaxID=3155126 RepID=UPI0033FC3884